MVGKIITVLGETEPAQAGFTLMHEHLYLDLRRNHPPDSGLSEAELAAWNADLDMANLHLARRYCRAARRRGGIDHTVP